MDLLASDWAFIQGVNIISNINEHFKHISFVPIYTSNKAGSQFDTSLFLLDKILEDIASNPFANFGDNIFQPHRHLTRDLGG